MYNLLLSLSIPVACSEEKMTELEIAAGENQELKQTLAEQRRMQGSVLSCYILACIYVPLQLQQQLWYRTIIEH